MRLLIYAQIASAFGDRSPNSWISVGNLKYHTFFDDRNQTLKNIESYRRGKEDYERGEGRSVDIRSMGRMVSDNSSATFGSNAADLIETVGTIRSPASHVDNVPERKGRTASPSVKVDGWELLPVEDALLPALNALLHVEDPKQLGKGNDVTAYPRKYTSLKLEAAWHCVAPDRDVRYEAAKNEVKRDILELKKQGKNLQLLPTKLDQAGRHVPATGGGLDRDLNEKWLLHGTKPEFVLKLLKEGFNERVTSSSGMLGRGVYLAENAEKVDQYCLPDSGKGNPEFEELHRILFPNEPDAFRHPAGPPPVVFGRASPLPPGGDNDLFYVFVVRALCGYFLRSHDLNDTRMFQKGADRRELCEVPESNVRYHSLIFDGSSRGFRYREFVFKHSDLTNIQYLLAYRRV